MEEVENVQTIDGKDRETFVKKIEVADDVTLNKSAGPK